MDAKYRVNGFPFCLPCVSRSGVPRLSIWKEVKLRFYSQMAGFTWGTSSNMCVHPLPHPPGGKSFFGKGEHPGEACLSQQSWVLWGHNHNFNMLKKCWKKSVRFGNVLWAYELVRKTCSDCEELMTILDTLLRKHLFSFIFSCSSAIHSGRIFIA